MKVNSILLATLITISSLCLLQSCFKPDNENEECKNFPTEYYTLPANHIAMIPHAPNDTICLVSNTGDTVEYIGTGSKQFFNTRDFELYSNPKCAAQGRGTEKLYEAYKMLFVDTLNNSKIELTHYLNYFTKQLERGYEVQVAFAGGEFYITDSHVSNSEVQNYLGDVTFGGILYKDANKVRNYANPNDTISYMLINSKQGILKIQLGSTQTWERIPN
jgi:hypothetical protein